MPYLTSDWNYQARGYVHFDMPLPVETLRTLVRDPEWVAARKFWPLLGYRIVERRRKKDGTGFKLKARPIAYASHVDAAIFSYYAWLLAHPYEAAVRHHGLDNVVLGYRRILLPTGDRGKANFHFAAEAFREIQARGECQVVAMDLEKFFDSIPHKPLYNAWCSILSAKKLPSDHLAVFKAATQFATVSSRKVRETLGIGLRQMKETRCFEMPSNTFHEKIRATGFINVNRKSFGIPQGLPMSGLLANIVMFDTDLKMHSAAQRLSASYRRYSDDVLIIGHPDAVTSLIELLNHCLADLKLKVNSGKTEIASFHRKPDGRLSVTGKPVQYLGMLFDGTKVLIRSQTIVRFSKRMRKAVQLAAKAARKATPAGTPVRIRKRDLYNRFSHLMVHPETPLNRRPRSTVYKYAKLAQVAVSSLTEAETIEVQLTRQLSRFWNRLNRHIREAESRLNAGIAKPGTAS